MKSLNYTQIIMNAVENEIEAYTFYTAASEKVKDSNLQTLFRDLAGEEKKHREYLRGLILKGAAGMHFDELKDYGVTDAIDEPALSADMKPIDGLVLAIKKELNAMQMYTRLSNASTSPEQKKLFLELVSMEKNHKARLEDIYTNMAFSEAW